jgi:hypothetical protein
MTSPDYPVLALPGYELYQLAHLATFVADGLARYRRAGTRDERRQAARHVHAGRVALARATGLPETAAGPLPRPLDAGAYVAAQRLLSGANGREATVLALASLGRQSWGVVGFVPGIGPVGAEVADHETAGALREHLLSAPIGDISCWSVTREPSRLGLDRWGSADEAGVVAGLDPGLEQHRQVARRLRGLSPEVDQAIAERFAGVELDERRDARAAADATRAAARALMGECDEEIERLNHAEGSAGRSAAGHAAVSTTHPLTSKAAAAPTTIAGP